MAISVRIVSYDVQQKPDELEDRHDEGAEGDGSEGKCGCASESAQSRVFRL